MRTMLALLLITFSTPVFADVKFVPGEGFVVTDNQHTYKNKLKKPKTKKFKQKRQKNIIEESVGGLIGLASYYWQPQAIACGKGRFNPNAMTAAHKTLPCGTRVKVTNKRNGKSVIVKINDRGPYIKGRIIDLSRAAAQKINMTKAGVVPVIVQVL